MTSTSKCSSKGSDVINREMQSQEQSFHSSTDKRGFKAEGQNTIDGKRFTDGQIITCIEKRVAVKTELGEKSCTIEGNV